MQKESKNKMIGRDDNKKDKFFYPDYGVTIEAESKEEADKLLEEQINSK